jgi:hypothetical protein
MFRLSYPINKTMITRSIKMKLNLEVIRLYKLFIDGRMIAQYTIIKCS